MKLDRAMELLNQIIDHTSCARNCSDTIVELLNMGFTGEELYEEFGFNLHDIADAEEETEGIE